MADKFTDLKQIIVAIDKKYELVKDKLLSDGDPNGGKRTRSDSRKTPVVTTLSIKASNENDDDHNSGVSPSNNSSNNSNNNSNDNDDNNDIDPSMAKGRKLGGKRHFVFQYNEDDSNSPTDIDKNGNNKDSNNNKNDNGSDNNIDDADDGLQKEEEDHNSHDSVDDYNNDDNDDDDDDDVLYKILNLDEGTPSTLSSASSLVSPLVSSSPPTSVSVRSSSPLPELQVYPTITSFGDVGSNDSPNRSYDEEMLTSIVRNLSLLDSNSKTSWRWRWRGKLNLAQQRCTYM